MQPIEFPSIRRRSGNQIPHQPDDNRMIGSLLQHPIVIVFERTRFDCDRSNDSKRPCDLLIVAGKRRLIDNCVICRWPRDAAVRVESKRWMWVSMIGTTIGTALRGPSVAPALAMADPRPSFRTSRLSIPTSALTDRVL